ncbi:hypothetical protein C8K18_11069 [Paraburkholderia sp. GV068]|uniref:hypothetical protein n=1 Tax=unclassified Paraburkholderia TaxID=2615204 RepID=UPI000D31BCF2|nr:MULTISPECIES: hypothetical protein [unclassified Paraburkholderia]PTQ95970.1 hypothetical protein C8K19_11169 [Paraburkholderia sp. GV072]PUB02308.1 hypothetical protein C8K18_11069 [Paraburkholderia sp. GV068]
MAKTEIVLQWLENGSNVMNTYQAFLGYKENQTDSLSIIGTNATVVATVSNVFQMLQPIRILTNGLAANAALTKIVVDWKDPNKKVQAGDVLTLVSATGTMAATLLFWAEVGPEAMLVISAFAMTADLYSAFTPYVNTARIWLANALGNSMQITKPASVATAPLYWGCNGTFDTPSGYNLLGYDEIMGTKGLFACLTDQGMSNGALKIMGNPIPGSLTPVNDDSYRRDYCEYLQQKSGGTDYVSWMGYCPTKYP